MALIVFSTKFEALSFMVTWQNKYINLFKVKGLTQTTSDRDLVTACPALRDGQFRTWCNGTKLAHNMPRLLKLTMTNIEPTSGVISRTSNKLSISFAMLINHAIFDKTDCINIQDDDFPF